MIGKDFGYSSSTWNPWIQAGIAPALPGAVEFLNYVADQGVHVYYISNRKVLDDNSGYIGTKANLVALGLPFADEEHLLPNVAEKPLALAMGMKGDGLAMVMKGDGLVLFP